MNIKIFTRNGEPYSEMLKSLLTYYSLPFDNIEVTRNAEALNELLRISGQPTTPVIIADGKTYIGFDREHIKRVLGLPEDQAQ